LDGGRGHVARRYVLVQGEVVAFNLHSVHGVVLNVYLSVELFYRVMTFSPVS
jgi:hypothetical protein